MPQFQMIDTGEDPNPISSFLNKLGQDYRKDKDKMEIGNIISQYQQNQNDANAYENLMLNLEKSDISPSRRIEAHKSFGEIGKQVGERNKLLAEQFKQQQQKQAKAKESYEIFKSGGVDDEEAKRLSELVEPASARSMVKKSLDPFDRTLQNTSAKELPEFDKQILKSEDVRYNLNQIEDIAEKQLKGLTGYGKSIFNTESAAQVKNLSASSLDNIIKTFNPAGVLPTSKLNWIRETFAINPSDNRSTIRGKVKTLNTLNDQAEARAKRYRDLIREYKGNIPTEELQNFSKESGQLSDVLQEQYAPDTIKKDSKTESDGKVRARNKQSGKVVKIKPVEGFEEFYELI